MKRSNLLWIILMIFGSCECDQEPLGEVLGNPCYINEDGNLIQINKGSIEYQDRNLGICSTGKTQRDDKGNLECVGEIKPQQEDCNNLDDNCNGFVDDDFNGYALQRPYYSIDNTCIPMGVCKYASQECVDGNWICDYPDTYGKEVCDARDNDCDGSIDEDTDDEPIFDDSDRYVYSADPDTINVGECRAGYKECVDGVVSIRNMRTPIPEVCGNDDDDDCDGAVDEQENDSIQNDFALIVDYSGSMEMIISSVADALCSWSAQGILQNSRFAVIAIGYVGPDNDREMKVLTDFTDSGTACQVIRMANRQQFAGGVEYQLNATYDASDINSIRYINWSSDNKRVIIFSDEELQQDFQLTVEQAIESVVQQCNDSGYTVSAFITYNIPDQTLWVDLTQRCNGFLDYLNYDPQQMIDKLNYWVGSDC